MFPESRECTISSFSSRSRFSKKRRIAPKRSEIEKILDEIIQKITSQATASLHSIILFGSHAKGTAIKSSDIDLLFIVSNMKDKSVREKIERECAGYQYSHNVKISPLITDTEEFKKMLKSKEMNVGKEAKEYGIALYGSEQFWRLISWQE